MKAMVFGIQAIHIGYRGLVLTAGTESMSNTPHYLPRHDATFGEINLAVTVSYGFHFLIQLCSDAFLRVVQWFVRFSFFFFSAVFICRSWPMLDLTKNFRMVSSSMASWMLLLKSQWDCVLKKQWKITSSPVNNKMLTPLKVTGGQQMLGRWVAHGLLQFNLNRICHCFMAFCQLLQFLRLALTRFSRSFVCDRWYLKDNLLFKGQCEKSSVLCKLLYDWGKAVKYRSSSD